MGRELARQNGACWRCAKRVVAGCKKSDPLRASKKCVFLKKGAIWKENWLSRLEWSGRRNGLSLLSLLSLKKNKRAKNHPLVLLFIFCFLRFLYNRLFPIRLVFSNCILYIGFSQLDWFFLIVFYILASPNYIVFFPNCLYSAPVNCPIKKMAPVARSFMM